MSRTLAAPGAFGSRDPLLIAARLALWAAMGVGAIVTLSLALSVPTVLILNEQVMARLVEEGVEPESIWTVIAVLALLTVVAGLAFQFFRLLYRIVGSVGDGAPFAPANAARLQAMGWIALAVHFLGIPMAMFDQWVEGITGRGHGDFEFSFFGLLLALVLFVLARVFREGARMREELEGTI